VLYLIFLQEMVREYFGGLAKSKGTSGYRLSVYLFFDNTQEPLTPAEYQDGYNFFKTSRYGHYRMPEGHCLYLQASDAHNWLAEIVAPTLHRTSSDGLPRKARMPAAAPAWHEVS
jgi:hypothetical protein